MWKRMGEHGEPSWHTRSMSLALIGSVLSADVAADAEANLKVIAVTDDKQRAVHIMSVSGDPTLGEVLVPTSYWSPSCDTKYAVFSWWSPVRQHALLPGPIVSLFRLFSYSFCCLVKVQHRHCRSAHTLLWKLSLMWCAVAWVAAEAQVLKQLFPHMY